jgi:hypothetical protein
MRWPHVRVVPGAQTKLNTMKIEITMTELMLIVDMIKNGTEKDNEGDDFYLMQEFLDGDSHHKCTKCNATMDKTTK